MDGIKMKIVLCQNDIVWEDKLTNHAKVSALLKIMGTPKLCNGALIVLPEMCSTGFSMNVPLICEGNESLTEKFFAELARQYQACVVGGVVNACSSGPKGLNQSLAIGPDGAQLARYSKMQPFTLSGEAACYAAGERPALFEFGGFKIAQFVCYDLRFPELFRRAALLGAQLFTVIANWPLPRDAHWTALLRARAIENQAYVVGVNRCGRDPKYVYPGRSIVVDPKGEIILDAGGGEHVVGVEVSLKPLLDYRREFPALGDMRPEFSAFLQALNV